MRLARLLVAAIIIVVGGIPVPTAQVSALPPCGLWNGTTAQNEVDSQADLITIGTDANCRDADIVQIANITLTASPWFAISDFTGSYDGNDYAITGLTLDGTASGSAFSSGLFEVDTAGASFSDLRIGVSASASANFIGALVGYSMGPLTVTGVHVTGTLSGGSSVGGLIGSTNGDVTISASSHTGNVTGSAYVGGIIGSTGGTRVVLDRNSASGSVIGSGDNVGGIIGGTTFAGADSSISITDSTRNGNVTGSAYVGGIVGQTGVLTVMATDNTVTGNTQGSGNYVGGIIGITTTAGTGTSLVVARNAVTGHITGGAAVGGIVASTGVLSTTATHNTVNGNVTGTGNNVGGIIGWTTSGGPGTSLTLTNSTRTGHVNGLANVGGVIGQTGVVSVIVNDNVTSGNTYGSASYVGGVVGMTSTGGTGTSLTAVRNTVSGNITGNDSYVGGIVASTGVDTSTLTHNTVTGNVTGTGNNVGGIIGTTFSGGAGTGLLITNSIRTGHVTGSANVGGVIGQTGVMNVTLSANTLSGHTHGAGNYVGGVVGWTTSGGSGTSVTLSNTDITGNTIGAGSSVGGTIGSTAAVSLISVGNTIRGDVVAADDYAGGLVGWATSGGPATSLTVAEIDFFGNVNGRSKVGGLVGQTNFQLVEIVDATVDGLVSGSSSHTDVGGLIGTTGNFSGIVRIEDVDRRGGVSGGGEAGGLIGDAAANTLSVSRSSVIGNVTGVSTSAGSWVGGLVGILRTQSDSTIDTVFVSGDVSGYEFVGGLIGQAGYSPMPTVTISASFFLGSVSAIADRVGGFVGLANHSIAIESSFARANASGFDLVAGFIGFASSYLTIDRSYYQGAITAGIRKGSFYAATGPEVLIIENTFCTDDDCPSPNRIGVADLKSADFLTSKSWDMVGTWCIRGNINAGFPILRVFTSGPLDATVCAPVPARAPAPTPLYRVRIDPNGGSCIDGGSRTAPWTTEFTGHRYIPAGFDCSRRGFTFAGWADTSAPDVVRPLPLLVDPSDGVRRYFVAGNADLVAVWTTGPSAITDLVVFANFLCGPCTNAWLIHSMPPSATDVELSLDDSPITCFRQGTVFGLSLCELTPLAPGRHVLTMTPRRDGVRGVSTSQTFTLRS